MGSQRWSVTGEVLERIHFHSPVRGQDQMEASGLPQRQVEHDPSAVAGNSVHSGDEVCLRPGSPAPKRHIEEERASWLGIQQASVKLWCSHLLKVFLGEHNFSPTDASLGVVLAVLVAVFFVYNSSLSCSWPFERRFVQLY